VFLSYGRKDALEVAKRLEQDLDAAGFEVWMDIKKIGSGSLWQQEIEDGLRESQVVVSLLSPHAVRRAGQSDALDSVCLDELTFARTSSPPTPVIPAMVAPCEPPFIIYRLDYVHLMGWRDSEDQYQTGIKRLISGIHDALKGKVNYRIWEDRLRPLDFSDYMAQKRHGFVGREWLFEEINLWRFESDERALLITGDPGAGKSSIVAQLIHSNPDGQVIGYHCCQSNENETLRPARFVQSLAAMIASRVTAYAEQLEVPSVKEALEDKRCESDPGGAFLEGILQPLQKIAPPEEGVRYILIDALDEALYHAGANNIVEILATRIDRLPSWLRVLATTRNEPAVLQRLSGLRAKSIDASDPRNLGDLAAYIHQRLCEPSLAERLTEARIQAGVAVERICEKSAGNFLYAVNALDGIARDFYSFTDLDALPRGLDGLYLDFFRRIFGHEGSGAAEAAYRKARPVLQILCAAAEPVTRAELATASNLDPDEELPRLMRSLAQLLSRRTRANGEVTVAFYHKSVADWLVSNPDLNAFAVSPNKGRKLLADFCGNALVLGRTNPGWYVRRHAVEHFLETGDWDNASAALSDLDFIRARAVAREVGMMLLDYRAAIECLPEGETERRTEAARQAELDRYARDMAQYAAAWSRIRDRSLEDPPKLPRPAEHVRMWTSAEIAAERKRITEKPNRLDVVKAFRVFVASHTAALQSWAGQEVFLAQLARNDAPAGPVHEAGRCALKTHRGVQLNRQFIPNDTYNPLPACQAVLEGHTDSVLSLALSADGRRVISGSSDTTLRVWDLESGECLHVLEGHWGPVHSLALSADGRRVISGSWDFTLRVWDLESGQCLHVLEGHTKFVRSLALSADGRRVISGSDDNTLRVWDLESGECLHVLEGHTKFVRSLALSADGRRVISRSWDSTLRVWDVESGQCLAVCFLRGLETFDVSWSNRVMVAGFADGTVRRFRLENLSLGPFITTAHREVRSEDLPPGPATARPTCCGQLIPIPEPLAERIEHWSLTGSETAYTDPALLLNCPCCGTPLRMNPFFIDIPASS
jgi:WD40 repeat protein